MRPHRPLYEVSGAFGSRKDDSGTQENSDGHGQPRNRVMWSLRARPLITASTAAKIVAIHTPARASSLEELATSSDLVQRRSVVDGREKERKEVDADQTIEYVTL
jgi:hypothetical protein